MAGPLDSCRRTGPDIADLARRLYDEVWNAAHYEVADELFHRDFAYFAAPGLRGPEAKLAAIRRYRSSCPDLHIHIDDMIVQGDRVAVRWTLTGTDTGGLAGRPPTGRSIAAWGVDILGFQGGQIISDWIGVDWLSVFIQLGAIPDRGPTGEMGRASPPVRAQCWSGYVPARPPGDTSTRPAPLASERLAAHVHLVVLDEPAQRLAQCVQ